MQTKTFVVPNISCGHCTRTIENELGELAGVSAVKAQVDSRQVTVSWDAPADWPRIDALLHEIGYPPQQLIQL